MKEARLQTLSRVPILAGLSRRQLRRLVARTSEHDYPEGAAIVRQGTRGETVFVLVEGTARVVRGGRTVARLSPHRTTVARQMLRLVLPKGSLERQTLELFDAADLSVNRSSNVAYHATIDDPHL